MLGANQHRRAEKENKMTLAVDMYVNKHMTLRQIAEVIGVDYTTVSVYIKEARNEWRENRLTNMDEVLDRELAELDQMESETAVLFYRFKEHLEADDPYLASKEAADWVKARLKIKEQRQKLLGLNSPIKMQQSGEVTVKLMVADCGGDWEEEKPEDD